MTGMDHEALRKKFDEMDKDNSNFLDLEEATTALRAAGRECTASASRANPTPPAPQPPFPLSLYICLSACACTPEEYSGPYSSEARTGSSKAFSAAAYSASCHVGNNRWHRGTTVWCRVQSVGWRMSGVRCRSHRKRHHAEKFTSRPNGATCLEGGREGESQRGRGEGGNLLSKELLDAGIPRILFLFIGRPLRPVADARRE